MILFTYILLCSLSLIGANYEPTWDSLDSRPLPQWYDDAKFGIFLHWGIYSVPSFGSEWFWHSWQEKTEAYVDFMETNYRKSFTYQDFAKDFTAEFFDPEVWANIFANSGAKYVVLTSKHHEGFALWPSKYSYSWNAKDMGPGRDLVGDLSKAVRGKNLTFGLYHSLFEWYHPLYNSDKASNFTQNVFVKDKIIPEMKELVEAYEPAVIWSDGCKGSSDSYWDSKNFLAWLYNESPVKDYVVVNDRWGDGIDCHHGDFFTCSDRYNPGVLNPHKWENAMTIDKHSWGYRRNGQLSDYLTTIELLTELVSTVSCGGNLLMNVGPTSDGTIAPIFQQRLSDMGRWLSVNGDAIYGSKPWLSQNDSLTSNVWYTSKNDAIYVIVLFWPEHQELDLGSVTDIFVEDAVQVVLVGNEADGGLKWTNYGKNEYVSITFPNKADVKSEWAYVLKIEPTSRVYRL